MLKEIIGPANISSISSDLKDELTPYSIIIDEATDISAKKSMAVSIRYFKYEKIVDRFLELVECSDGTSEGIFQTLKNCLNRNKISVSSSIVGFGSDNCAVMMGKTNSVRTRLVDMVPTIFISGCACHLIHLCAVAANSKLPNYIEELTRDIYSHFAFSTKRREQFLEYQVFLNLQPHVFLKAGQTRWLSLEASYFSFNIYLINIK